MYINADGQISMFKEEPEKVKNEIDGGNVKWKVVYGTDCHKECYIYVEKSYERLLEECKLGFITGELADGKRIIIPFYRVTWIEEMKSKTSYVRL